MIDRPEGVTIAAAAHDLECMIARCGAILTPWSRPAGHRPAHLTLQLSRNVGDNLAEMS
jgi:hypothetical protein